jgi:hypothetical protein
MLEPYFVHRKSDTHRRRHTHYCTHAAAKRLLNLLGFFDCFVDRADHVKRLFRQMIEFAGRDHLEALDRVFE